MATATATRIIEKLAERFSNVAARAAAVNEVRTCQQYSEYLAGILSESIGLDEETAVFEWATCRGRMWES